jgi:hypothetical protein
VQMRIYKRIGESTAKWRPRVVGVSAIVLGVVGVVCPILFATDAGSPYQQRGLPRPDISWCMIAIAAHLYLIVSGGRLLIGRRPWLFGYFLALEAAYGAMLFVLLPGLVSVGVVAASEARWAADISFGFLAQICLGFPLWAWALSRRVARR